MNRIDEIVFDISEVAYVLGCALIFFYISQLIWPYLSLVYSNPNDSHGLLTRLQFNSFNNTLRYLFILIFTTVPTVVVSLLKTKDKKIILRLIFIASLLISYFLTALIHPDNKYILDFLHDGEQVGNAGLYLKGASLYDGIFFFHGAFNDPLVAVASFLLFTKSLGSFFLLTSYLHLISFLLFFILLFIVIRSDLIFFAASIWFFGFLTQSIDFQVVNFVTAQIRDIVIWVSLILFFFFIKNWFRSRILALTIGFLAGFEYFISFDRGYFLTFFIIFIALTVIFLAGNNEDRDDATYQLDFNFINLKEKFITAAIIFLGFTMGLFIQLPFVGIKSFSEFLRIVFLELPSFIGNFNEQEFPSIAQSFTHWFPIIISIINGITITYYFFVLKYIKKSFRLIFSGSEIYISVVFLLSIVVFRSALTRTDLYHLFYGSIEIFLVAFLILDYLTQKALFSTKKFRYYSAIKHFIWIFIVLWLLYNFNVPLIFQKNNYKKDYNFRTSDCFLNLEQNKHFLNLYLVDHLLCPPYKSMSKIKDFFNLPKVSDFNWITDSQKNTVDFLNKNTNEDDFVYVYSNEPAYYYFLKAKSPTRFAQVWLADSKKYRTEMLYDLIKNKPKYIIYSTSNWPERVEDMAMKDRFPQIDEWLMKNYPKKVYVNQSVILMK